MSESEPPPSNPAKGRIVLWLAGLGVPLLLLLAWWPSGKPKTRPALPNPNGYDYFVKAGGVLTGVWTNSSHQTLTATELQAFLSANQACLELVREGLRHQSHTHLDYDATYIERVMTNNISFRRCGRLLVGEGRLAELEARPRAAVDGYVDAMRLGQECTRGGVMIERLVGIAIELTALTALRPLISTLATNEARRALESLQKLDASHDAATVTIDAEDDWLRHAHSPWRLLMATLNPSERASTLRVRASIVKNVDTVKATRRRAIVETAARLFELENGRRPTSYTDLVPIYLKAIPLDPTTGKEVAHPF